MCKICKTCKKSDFGVIRRKTEEKAARLINGEISEYFDGSYEVHEELLYNYCFTCSKEITEDDLEEVNKCRICKKEVSHINANGVCEECARKAEKLSNVSKEDLILMLLKQSEEGLSKLEKSSQSQAAKLEKVNKSYTVNSEKAKPKPKGKSAKVDKLKEQTDMLATSAEENKLKKETDISGEENKINESSSLAHRSPTSKAQNIKKVEKNSKEKLKNNKKSDTINSIKERQIITKQHKVEIDNEKKSNSKRNGKSRAQNKSEIDCKSKIYDKPENSTNQSEKEYCKQSNIKEENLISQDTIDNAISDNKGKVKDIPKRKDYDIENSEHVTDEISNVIQDIEDISLNFNDIECIPVNLNDIEDSSLFTIEVKDSNLVNDTLLEIEDIINNINTYSIKYEV